jgi:hypothetical protein
MERYSLRSRRRALVHAATTTLAVAAAIPAVALADKPAEQRNGPPGPAGNPNHGQAPADRGNGNPGGHAQQPATPAPPRRPEGRPVRAHGNPPAPPARSPQSRSPQSRSQQPAPSRPESRSNGNNGVPHQKTTLCHATGSATNPYVEITISDRAVQAHARHQDGRDIIPAPAGGCPGTAAAETPAAEELAAPVAEEVAAVTEQRTERKGESEVAGVTQTNAPAADDDQAGEPAAATAAAETTDAADEGSLPFTGLELLLVLMIGAALLLAGYALRRSRTTT